MREMTRYFHISHVRQKRGSHLSALRGQRGSLHLSLHPRWLHQLSELLLEKLAAVGLLGLLRGWRLLLLLQIVNEGLLSLSCCQRGHFLSS